MKYKIISGMFVLVLLALIGIVSAQSDTYQYGMMGSNGQFYQYGMMGNNSQFYPTSNYGGMMGGGMMGMMQMMTGNGAYAGYGSYNSGAVLLSWITYLLIIILLISAIYWLIKSANRKR